MPDMPIEKKFTRPSCIPSTQMPMSTLPGRWSRKKRIPA